MKHLIFAIIVAGGCIIHGPRPAEAHALVCQCTNTGSGPHGRECRWVNDH